MLEFYVESGYRLRQLRECATGDYMDPFAHWLESAGFRRRSAQLLLRGAAHLGEWAAIEQVQTEQFDRCVLDAFADHLDACCCTHPFRGCNRRHLRGAKRFTEHLQSRGIAAFAEHDALPDLVEAFGDWMSRCRIPADSAASSPEIRWRIASTASLSLRGPCSATRSFNEPPLTSSIAMTEIPLIVSVPKT